MFSQKKTVSFFIAFFYVFDFIFKAVLSQALQDEGNDILWQISEAFGFDLPPEIKTIDDDIGKGDDDHYR